MTKEQINRFLFAMLLFMPAASAYSVAAEPGDSIFRRLSIYAESGISVNYSKTDLLSFSQDPEFTYSAKNVKAFTWAFGAEWNSNDYVFSLGLKRVTVGSDITIWYRTDKYQRDFNMFYKKEQNNMMVNLGAGRQFNLRSYFLRPVLGIDLLFSPSFNHLTEATMTIVNKDGSDPEDTDLVARTSSNTDFCIYLNPSVYLGRMFRRGRNHPFSLSYGVSWGNNPGELYTSRTTFTNGNKTYDFLTTNKGNYLQHMLRFEYVLKKWNRSKTRNAMLWIG